MIGTHTAVNVDHVHLLVKYPPKYSVSYIAMRIKRRRDTYRIRRSKMQKHNIQALYLSQGFSDFGRLTWLT